MDNDGPESFEITVGGAAGIAWQDWLDDVVVTHKQDVPFITVLKGAMDQATLRGVLNRIWDLNLTLISVVPFEHETNHETEIAGTPAAAQSKIEGRS